MEYDNKSHEIAERVLLRDFGLRSEHASEADDLNSVADRFIVDDMGNRIPLGLKFRGDNAGSDCPLTAWSAAKGLLPEFRDAGGKLYFVSYKDKHRLVQFAEQHLLNKLAPDENEWQTITNGAASRWIRYPYALVRRSSKASRTQQGVIYVPRMCQGHEMYIILAEWDRNEQLFPDMRPSHKFPNKALDSITV